MQPERRAVFLDRDGTLMRETNYCGDPAMVEAFPGAAEALHCLRTAGWLTVVITNQSGIGRGYFTVANYEAVNAELFRQLDHTPDGVYFCADHPDTATPRRKPGPGMIEEAARDLGIAVGRSWMIGDKDVDVACGRAAGCRSILVLTGYGADHRACGADLVVSSLAEAAERVLALSDV
jgi:D-glycero-D-manno-heptose 1,7-bisphosphate phosphatase